MGSPSPGAGDLIDGRYRLIDVLARGGSATVWRARDERLSRTVALKLLDAGRAADEAHTLAQLSHPHIAAVFDSGRHDGSAYLVLELVDGVSLAQVLGERELPWQAAVAVCAQTAQALAAAHSRGLVHRDVTPANIMLGAAGVKLVDFGISTVSGRREVDADGGLRGTPVFTAPERLSAKTAQEPSDVYSLGVVLYRLLSGRMPWIADSQAAAVAAQRTTDPEPLPTVDGLPSGVAELCMRCLARDPQDRPTAAETADGLQQETPRHAWNLLTASTLDGLAPATQIMHRSGATRSRPHRRAQRIAAATAAAALVWIAGWWAIGWTSDGQPPVQQAVAAEPATPQCAVTYQLMTDDGKAFRAQLVVASQTPLPSAWQLALHLPPGGRSADVSVDPGWRHVDGTLFAPTQPGLADGEKAKLRLTGRHTSANPLPATATIGDRSCALMLLGPTGTPSRSPVPARQTTPGSSDVKPPSSDKPPSLGKPPRSSKKQPGANGQGENQN